jgi:hypothetical protein
VKIDADFIVVGELSNILHSKHSGKECEYNVSVLQHLIDLRKPMTHFKEEKIVEF